MAESNPLLKKLLYKGQPALIENVPDELRRALAAVKPSDAGTTYSFALVFVKSMTEAEDVAGSVATRLAPDALFWLAYPKQTSTKYRADFNRDTGNALFQKHGLRGVAMISLDDDWSAMRFRPIADRN